MLGRLKVQAGRRPRVVAALLATFVGAMAVGAYARWALWQAMDPVLIPLAAVVLTVLGLVVALIPRGRARLDWVYLLAAAAGLFLGQAVGPSRPALTRVDAAATVALERPSGETGEGRGSCGTSRASELQLDASMRLDLRPANPAAPEEVDQRDFVNVFLTVGDRWRDRPIHRSDNVDLMVLVDTAAADDAELALVADDASLMELAWTEDAGSLRFDRLVVDTSRSGPGAAPVDLAGTITWTCRERSLPQRAAEIADSACAESTNARCVEDVLAAMLDMPGSLVAVCEFDNGSGAVIALERPEDAPQWCADQGPAGRPIDVLTLPEE